MHRLCSTTPRRHSPSGLPGYGHTPTSRPASATMNEAVDSGPGHVHRIRREEPTNRRDPAVVVGWSRKAHVGPCCARPAPKEHACALGAPVDHLRCRALRAQRLIIMRASAAIQARDATDTASAHRTACVATVVDVADHTFSWASDDRVVGTTIDIFHFII